MRTSHFSFNHLSNVTYNDIKIRPIKFYLNPVATGITTGHDDPKKLINLKQWSPHHSFYEKLWKNKK